MKITFHGAAREVAGSCTLLETDSGANILVDCGMFQGAEDSYERNLEPFPFDIASIDALVVTHAHIDHVGRIPKLVKDGYHGRIFATHPTRLFMQHMWRDAAKVMKDDARRHDRPRVYTAKDTQVAFNYVHGMEYGTTFKLAHGVSCTFRDAGHIFGSSFAQIDAGGKRVVFSGDLGNDFVPILRDTEPLDAPDIVVIESTYGDRMHEDRETREEILRQIVMETIERKGILLIPAFSLERTQEILYLLNGLVETNKLPGIPTFLDSPLATKVLPIYKQFPEYYDREAKELKKAGDDFFRFPGLRITKKAGESAMIAEEPPPKVIISGSGMMHGGRIMHHLVEYLNDPRTILFIVGYQAAGTLGRSVLEGAELVHVEGEEMHVRATVRAVGSFSAHGDQEKLLKWLASGKKMPERVFCNHGEEPASLALADRIGELYGVEATVPERGVTYGI